LSIGWLLHAIVVGRLCRCQREALARRAGAGAARGGGLLCHLAVAILLGIVLNFTPIDPIKALYWSAVINGVVAVPVMVILMLMTAEPRVMGDCTVKGP
jgi:Mn2+/Fe2+ NRAMP family transporter